MKPSWQVTKLIECDGVPARRARRDRRCRPGAWRGRRHAGVAAHEAAHVVAELAVPLGPALTGGERAHLVEAGGVPGLGDELGVGEHRILGDALEHRRVGQHLAVLAAAEDRGEVEAEAVDVHLRHPVAQAVDDQLADDRVVAVERVAAAGEVAVGAGLGIEQVVDGVVEPREATGSGSGRRRPRRCG